MSQTETEEYIMWQMNLSEINSFLHDSVWIYNMLKKWNVQTFFLLKSFLEGFSGFGPGCSSDDSLAAHLNFYLKLLLDWQVGPSDRHTRLLSAQLSSKALSCPANLKKCQMGNDEKQPWGRTVWWWESLKECMKFEATTTSLKSCGCRGQTSVFTTIFRMWKLKA